MLKLYHYHGTLAFVAHAGWYFFIDVILQNPEIGQSFCGDYDYNQPISSVSDNIRVSFAAEFENSVVTSLKVIYVNSVLIAMAGTGSGQLLKVNKWTWSWLLFHVVYASVI